MQKNIRFICWQDDDMWLGYLEEYPDYVMQGETLDELKENLIDIKNCLSRHNPRHKWRWYKAEN